MSGFPGCSLCPSVHVAAIHKATLLGRNSLVPWALGILPYKDATFTGPQRWGATTCLQRAGAAYTMPEWCVAAT